MREKNGPPLARWAQAMVPHPVPYVRPFRAHPRSFLWSSLLDLDVTPAGVYLPAACASSPIPGSHLAGCPGLCRSSGGQGGPRVQCIPGRRRPRCRESFSSVDSRGYPPRPFPTLSCRVARPQISSHSLVEGGPERYGSPCRPKPRSAFIGPKSQGQVADERSAGSAGWIDEDRVSQMDGGAKGIPRVTVPPSAGSDPTSSDLVRHRPPAA